LNKIILLLLFLASGFTAFSQTPDCTKFREGKFRIADTRAGAVIIAERNNMYQTETSEALKAVVRFKISWQDNCSYTLKLDKVQPGNKSKNHPNNRYRLHTGNNFFPH
jgi:hypothetical protein